jgi:heme iron utilization protein
MIIRVNGGFMPTEEQLASDNAREGDPAADARRWLLDGNSATLATLSADPLCVGYPFCSVVAYALDGRGRPIIQIASIAAHTKNVCADNRVSLFLQAPPTDGHGDAQAHWRITVVGRLQPVAVDDQPEAMARLSERVPKALAYANTHDFQLWQLEIEHVRYIAGFGRICWIEGNEVMRDPHGAGLGEAAPGAIAHMNDDHASSMIDMCSGLYGVVPKRAAMTAIDRTGFLITTMGPPSLLHFSFGREIDAESLRIAVVEVVKRARIAASRSS